MASDLVGRTGFEPVTSSRVRERRRLLLLSYYGYELVQAIRSRPLGPSPSAAIVTQLVTRARPPMRTVGTGLLAVKQCSLTRVEQVRPAHTRYASDVVTADGALATRGGGSAQLRLCALDREGSAAAIWPSRLMPGTEIPFRLDQVAAPAKAACRSPSQGPMKEASEARLATRPQTNRPKARRPHRQQGLRQPPSPMLR